MPRRNELPIYIFLMIFIVLFNKPFLNVSNSNEYTHFRGEDLDYVSRSHEEGDDNEDDEEEIGDMQFLCDN